MAARAACSCSDRAGTLPDLFIYREEEGKGGGGAGAKNTPILGDLKRLFLSVFCCCFFFDDSLTFGLVLRRLENRL